MIFIAHVSIVKPCPTCCPPVPALQPHQVAALDALVAWLEAEPPRVEARLLDREALDRLVMLLPAGTAAAAAASPGEWLQDPSRAGFLGQGPGRPASRVVGRGVVKVDQRGGLVEQHAGWGPSAGRTAHAAPPQTALASPPTPPQSQPGLAPLLPCRRRQRAAAVAARLAHPPAAALATTGCGTRAGGLQGGAGHAVRAKPCCPRGHRALWALPCPGPGGPTVCLLEPLERGGQPPEPCSSVGPPPTHTLPSRWPPSRLAGAQNGLAARVVELLKRPGATAALSLLQMLRAMYEHHPRPKVLRCPR